MLLPALCNHQELRSVPALPASLAQTQTPPRALLQRADSRGQHRTQDLTTPCPRPAWRRKPGTSGRLQLPGPSSSHHGQTRQQTKQQDLGYKDSFFKAYRPSQEAQEAFPSDPKNTFIPRPTPALWRLQHRINDLRAPGAQATSPHPTGRRHPSGESGSHYLPRFSLSMALLLPAYVGLISFPSSSMMASSSAYLLWGTWLFPVP